MLRFSTIAASWMVLAALQMPALAQQSSSSSASGDKAPTGGIERSHGLLRASEVIGAYIYNDQGTSIGTVNDLLVGDDGKAQQVIVSVGGFLGIGTKYVEIPYDQIKVQPSRDTSAAASAPAATQPAGSSTGSTTAGSSGGATGETTTAGTPPPADSGAMKPAATDSGGASPPKRQYFSLVLPGATKDSLTSMADFKYE